MKGAVDRALTLQDMPQNSNQNVMLSFTLDETCKTEFISCYHYLALVINIAYLHFHLTLHNEISKMNDYLPNKVISKIGDIIPSVVLRRQRFYVVC